VEGAELGVLQGGFDSLERLRPRLVVEDHGRDAVAMASLLQGLGYRVDRIPYSGPTSGQRVMWICHP
jgi:Methyltransferase FkbM domain